MKKMIAFILATLLSLTIGALAESTSINCLINEGSYIIQIDDPEGDLGWMAASGDESIVKLYDADLIEDTFVARFDPVADGEATVSVKHYTGIACDEAHTFDLVVKDGAVTESTGGSYTASPDPIEFDPYLIGDWDADDSAVMVITKNPSDRAWDVEIASPLTHGACIFMTTIYYDCDLNCFVYDKGKFWDVPITEDVYDELGEAKIAGTAGSFTLNDDGTLTWTDFKEATGEDEMVFKKAEASQAQNVIAPQFDGLDTTEGTYSVAFDRDDLKDGILNNVRIFTEDTYDIVDVAQMKIGDTFEAEGETITISSLETDEYGDILINGGFEEENGYTLTTHEDTNGWTTTSRDDFCTYTERAAVTLELAENVTLTDSWDIEKEPVQASGIEAVSSAIMTSENGDFYEHNTELRTEGGKVVEINRRYVP